MRKKNTLLAETAIAAAVGMGLLLSSTMTHGLPFEAAALDRIIEMGKYHNKAMKHLDRLVNSIGARPVGSQGFVEACKWARDEFKRFGLENARLEEVDWKGTTVYNVIADIRGAGLPDEYVILGAHIDSAPSVNGATDDGAGVAAVMEAARILAASDVKPRRTIRFILFGGEEIGFAGSKGYLESHDEIMPNVSAVYIMDGGANYISGIAATEPLAADLRGAFAKAATLDPEMSFEVEEVEYLPAADPNCCAAGAPTAGCTSDGKVMAAQENGKLAGGCGAQTSAAEGEGFIVKRVTAEGETLTARVLIPGAPKDFKPENLDLKALGITPEMLKKARSGDSVRVAVALGSSDHAPFLAAGIPAFLWKQNKKEPVLYPAHTKQDTYDKVIPGHLEHSATVIALGAFETANLDHLLSRKKLTAPQGPASGGAVDIGKDRSSSCGGD
jgi:hypothetical protein